MATPPAEVHIDAALVTALLGDSTQPWPANRSGDVGAVLAEFG